MPSIYNPNNHYWQRGDGRVFSSLRGGFVAATEAAYVAWLASGGVPSGWPVDAAGADSDAELAAVLIAAGCCGAAAALDLRAAAGARLQRYEAAWGLPRLIRENIGAFVTNLSSADAAIVLQRTEHLNALRAIATGADTGSNTLPVVPA